MRQSKLTNKQQWAPAPRSFASMRTCEIRNSWGENTPEGAGCWARARLVPPALVLVPYLLSHISLSIIFVCTSAARTTLKPGSRNSLGQSPHPSFSQFLVHLLLLLPQNGKIFLFAPVMSPLVHTPWFRQPFFYGLLNSHVRHFQHSRGEDNLCYFELWLFTPSNSSVVPTSTPDLRSSPSHAGTRVIPRCPPRSSRSATSNPWTSCSSHKNFYRAFSFPPWADPHTTRTHWYSSLWPSFTAASTAN